jgi:hypothetical protein
MICRNCSHILVPAQDPKLAAELKGRVLFHPLTCELGICNCKTEHKVCNAPIVKLNGEAKK